ncbi:MAG: type II toxin-antitoxin system VapC family toxin [Candidatus Latescibacterota bacterium]
MSGAPGLLLDTDILSGLMRQHRVLVERGRAYLDDHGRFTFSVIAQYEVMRGLRARGAERQVRAFAAFCDQSRLLPVTPEVGSRAAEIYAALSRRGELIGDADILIAATALVHGLGLATHNVAHLSRVDGLSVDDWLAGST